MMQHKMDVYGQNQITPKSVKHYNYQVVKVRAKKSPLPSSYGRLAHGRRYQNEAKPSPG